MTRARPRQEREHDVGERHGMESMVEPLRVENRRAPERMNRDTRAASLAWRIGVASGRVRPDSMRVNAEFDAIDRDVDD